MIYAGMLPHVARRWRSKIQAGGGRGGLAVVGREGGRVAHHDLSSLVLNLITNSLFLPRKVPPICLATAVKTPPEWQVPGGRSMLQAPACCGYKAQLLLAWLPARLLLGTRAWSSQLQKLTSPGGCLSVEVGMHHRRARPAPKPEPRC